MDFSGWNKQPEAFWLRTGGCGTNGAAKRTLLYRVSPNVLQWILWKSERIDETWVGYAISQETREGIRALADSLSGVIKAARIAGVAVELSTDATRPPRLPPAPIGLGELEHADWCEQPVIGEFRWKKAAD